MGRGRISEKMAVKFFRQMVYPFMPYYNLPLHFVSSPILCLCHHEHRLSLPLSPPHLGHDTPSTILHFIISFPALFPCVSTFHTLPFISPCTQTIHPSHTYISYIILFISPSSVLHLIFFSYTFSYAALHPPLYIMSHTSLLLIYIS